MKSSELWRRFQEVATRAPERISIESAHGSTTFDEVLSAAKRLADSMTELGVQPGCVVHMALPNLPVFLPAFLALNKLGVTTGLVSSRYRDAEFHALSERAPPLAYLTTSALAGVLERSIPVAVRRTLAVSGRESDLELVFPGPRNSDPVPAPASIAPLRQQSDGWALLKFTSGSTGAPKGVGLTEANLMAEATNVVESLGIGPSDRILVPVPISHSYGFDLGILPVIFAGATAILHGAFVPREVLADLSKEDVTIFLGVPSMYRVLSELELDVVPDLSHLRYLLSCTAPLLPSLIADFHARYGVPVCQHYGSSETGAISNHIPSRVLERPASVGVAMRNVDIRIVDEEGNLLGRGEEGEIVIRSKAVSRGYVTAEASGDGNPFQHVDDCTSEYRTGDLGMLDDEGFLFWKGRKDQVINVGGLKVYPSEVARVLESCPAVASARVVGVKDLRGEEVVHAIVTLSQSIREQDILAFCRKHLADYKIPRRVEITDAIANGDIAKMRELSGDA